LKELEHWAARAVKDQAGDVVKLSRLRLPLHQQ
jgi:hypothetical protein